MQSAKSFWIKVAKRLLSFLVCLFIASLLSGSFASQAQANHIPVVPPTTNLLSQTGSPAPDPKRHHDQQRDFYEQRAYPNITIPNGAYHKALQQANQLPQSVPPRFAGNPSGRSPRSISPTVAWTSIGPNAVKEGSLKYSGRTNGIAINPSNPNIIYIATANGGVWQTTDGGANWSPKTDSQSSLAAGAITIDPTYYNTIYVGTGEENFSDDSYYGTGVLKSTDGGASWTLLGASVFANPSQGSPSFSKIIVDPSNANNVIAATSRGVFRSTDAGSNWTLTLNQPYITDMVADTRSNPIKIYAGAGKSSINGFYYSSDGGATFTASPYGTGYPTSFFRVSLDISASSPNPSTPATLYAVFADTYGASLGVYQSVDGGLTWSQKTSGSNSGGPRLLGSGFGDQGWYDIFLKIDPNNPAIVYVGGVDVWKTTNSGTNWTNLTNVYGGASPQIHPDQHNMAFKPGSSSTFYVVDDGGVWVSSDSGLSFSGLNNGLATLQFYGGAAGANFNTNPVVLGGTQDNSTSKYNGSSLDWNIVTCGDGMYTAIDPTNSQNMFTDCQNGDFYFSTDGGAIWSQPFYGISDNRPFVAPFVMDPNNPARLVMGTQNRLFQTTDHGGSWTPVGTQSVGGNTYYGTKAVAIAKSDPTGNTIYASGSVNKLWVTTNNGASFTSNTTPLPNRYITSIAIDPTNAAKALVTLSGFGTGHIWQTTDTGGTLSDVSGNLPDSPVNTVLIDPLDPANTWYIGTDVGFFFTTNAGGTWSSAQANLPKSPIFELFTDPQFSTIIAATHGRSMFSLCTLLVNKSGDDSSCGTLRYALNQATNGSLINFVNPLTINIASALPPVASGVKIQGSPCPGAPFVLIKSNPLGVAGPGLELLGNNTVSGIKVEGFSGPQIKADVPNGGNNKLSCVIASQP